MADGVAVNSLCGGPQRLVCGVSLIYAPVKARRLAINQAAQMLHEGELQIWEVVYLDPGQTVKSGHRRFFCSSAAVLKQCSPPALGLVGENTLLESPWFCPLALDSESVTA